MFIPLRGAGFFLQRRPVLWPSTHFFYHNFLKELIKLFFLLAITPPFSIFYMDLRKLFGNGFSSFFRRETAFQRPPNILMARAEMKQCLNVLLADDEFIVCKRLKADLEKDGYLVEAFTSSAEALDRIKQKDFDIIITDLKMEGVDGEQILERAKEKSPTVEVIIITGYATMKYARRCIEKGAFDLIAKPFKLDAIRMAVKRASQKITAIN
jgi:CheY-like chemotaxis protein